MKWRLVRLGVLRVWTWSAPGFSVPFVFVAVPWLARMRGAALMAQHGHRVKTGRLTP
jgi:hypothetical protein